MTTSASQQKASNAHRTRARSNDLVRVEVQAPSVDADLIKAIAEVLRSRSEAADNLRKAISHALPRVAPKNAFDIFGSELPDEAFEGAFDQPRPSNWREIEL